ncbi:MAG: mechanosensitive ion channel, partial [Ignavibacteriales bacterium]|nr:mechanosensitive ion channel [Ignavibacteriales bacterium]
MLLEKVLHLFRELINNDLLYEIILCIIVFLIFILFSRVFGFIVRKLVKPVVEKTKTQLDDIIVEIAVVGVRRLLILFGAYVSLMIFKNGLDIIEITSNKSLIQRHPYLHNTVNFIENSLFIIGTILFLFICGKLLSFGLDWYAERTNANENKDLSGSLFPLFKKVAMLLLSMLAVAIVLAKFQIDISAFVVSLGVGSLAIALAAQDTISNMISGFIIMVDRPFRIGDRIKIGTEINGDVVLIGIRSTKILDFDKNFLIVPNNDIVKSRIINMTYPTNLTRVVVDFSIGYGEDLDRIKKIVFDI